MVRMVRIVADPSGFDRASDREGRRWGGFINLNQEYVELRNEMPDPQDLSNWELRDASRHRFLFPEGTVLSPSATLRVRSGAGEDTETDLFWNRQAPVWNNLGDTASLFDNNNTLIDQRSFPDFSPETPAFLLPQFRAETYPAPRTIALLWDIPLLIDSTSFPDPDIVPIFILRRERRFPGQNRRGVVPVRKQLLNGREDGSQVYHTLTFNFDFEEQWEDREGDRRIVTRYQYQGNRQNRVLVRSLREEYEQKATGESQPRRLTVRVIDREGLEEGNIYYYTAFVGPEFIFSSQTQASALATDDYKHNLFAGLPQVHQQFDTATPPPLTVAQADAQKGQLQRFLEVGDSHADMFHGFIDGWRDLYNTRRVDSRFLPHLAHQIGWQFKNERDEDRQRTELQLAPLFYETVGTVSSIAAIINMLTGWKTEVREFVHNVLLSVDTSRFENLREGVAYADGETPPEGDRAYLDGSLQVSSAYQRYLEDTTNPRPAPPLWQGRQVPPGSLNIAALSSDPVAQSKLRDKAFDDPTVYSYHAPPANEPRNELPNPDVLYNRETIGIYITADIKPEEFSPGETSQQLYRIVREFLPIQVRPVFFIRLSETETYDTLTEVQEDITDTVAAGEEERYGDISEQASDRIPGWRWFVTNRLEHRAVDTEAAPIDTSSRTWHIALDQGLEDT